MTLVSVKVAPVRLKPAAGVPVSATVKADEDCAIAKVKVSAIVSIVASEPLPRPKLGDGEGLSRAAPPATTSAYLARSRSSSRAGTARSRSRCGKRNPPW
jgi:hypothetical protein